MNIICKYVSGDTPGNSKKRKMTKLSSLARQLRNIQQTDHSIGGISTTQHRFIASFLFDEREAGDIDNATILTIAKGGLEELKAVEPAFGKFEIVLFGENTIELHRATMTKQQNASLNGTLRTFLRLLSPYFMMKAAHKCLEWLIRKYRINELNIDSLMDCVLPYHETVQFVRMSQIIFMQDNSKWGFLHEVKKDARVISRSFLARRALADRSLLDGIFECVEWMVLKHRDSEYKKPTIYLSFFTMLLLDYIQAIPKVELTQVLHLYPIALRLVKIKRVPECAMSSFMIILALAQRYPILSLDSITDYIDFASRACPDTLVPQLIISIARLVDICYLTVPAISPRAFNVLSRLPGFAAVSHEIVKKYHLPHFETILAASFAAIENSKSRFREEIKI